MVDFGVVIVHFGDPLPTASLVRHVAEDQLVVVVNNGEPNSGELEELIPETALMIKPSRNVGYGRGANLGIEACVARGVEDVVVLANDARANVSNLAELVATGHKLGAFIVAPRVLYDDGITIWADGLCFSRTWGVARNCEKGSSAIRPERAVQVDYVTGHVMALLGCGKRRWLRFDERFFLYYEDVAMCDLVRARGGRVVLDRSVQVLHDKPGGVAYRFEATQQRQMARSGALYWRTYVQGWRRFTHLGGLLAITLFRLGRSRNLRSAAAGVAGFLQGLVGRTSRRALPDGGLASILFIGPGSPLRGGVAQHGDNLVQALRSRGCRVDHVSWRQPYPRLLVGATRPPEPLNPNIHILRWWDPTTWLRIRVRARRADLVVFPWVTPFHAVPLFVASGGRKVRKVAIVHNARPHERFPIGELLTRWVLRQASEAVVHSRAVAGELAAMVPDLRVHFVPHPPNLPAEAAPLPPRPPVRLLFLGYVRGYKGVDMLFEALAELRKRGQDMVLTVAGEFWDDVRDYQRLGERLGISDAVELQPRYVPDGEVSALIASHHIVVAPYRTASQSGVIPIACSAGRSVVVTPVGGLAEGLGTEYPGIAGAATASAIADAVERVVAAGFLVSESAAAGWDDVARVALEAGGFEDSLAGWR